MAEKRTPNQQSDSTHHLKNVFEQSLAVLCRDRDNDPSTRNGRNRGVRCDSLPLYMDPANLDKRALDAAAKALATLWKISNPGRIRLQARDPHLNRSIS